MNEATKAAAAWALRCGGDPRDVLDTVGITRLRDLDDWSWYYYESLDAYPPMPLAQALGELADEVDRDRDPAQLVSPDRLPALLECLRGEVTPARDGRRTPEDVVNARKALYGDGLSDCEIARRTGVSSRSIHAWRLSNGLPRNAGPGRPRKVTA